MKTLISLAFLACLFAAGPACADAADDYVGLLKQLAAIIKEKPKGEPASRAHDERATHLLEQMTDRHRFLDTPDFSIAPDRDITKFKKLVGVCHLTNQIATYYRDFGVTNVTSAPPAFQHGAERDEDLQDRAIMHDNLVFFESELSLLRPFWVYCTAKEFDVVAKSFFHNEKDQPPDDLISVIKQLKMSVYAEYSFFDFGGLWLMNEPSQLHGEFKGVLLAKLAKSLAETSPIFAPSVQLVGRAIISRNASQVKAVGAAEARADLAVIAKTMDNTKGCERICTIKALTETPDGDKEESLHKSLPVYRGPTPQPGHP